MLDCFLSQATRCLGDVVRATIQRASSIGSNRYPLAVRTAGMRPARAQPQTVLRGSWSSAIGVPGLKCASG
jgi:hypothetical protein